MLELRITFAADPVLVGFVCAKHADPCAAVAAPEYLADGLWLKLDRSRHLRQPAEFRRHWWHDLGTLTFFAWPLPFVCCSGVHDQLATFMAPAI